MLTKVTSTLPPDLDELIERVIGCLIEVHRRLGPGYLESTYRRAARIELAAQSIPFEREKVVEVLYRGQRIHGQRLDLVVDGRLIVEVKAVSHLAPIHDSQLVSYLTALNLRAGLLVNFNQVLLKHGIKRIAR